MAWLTRAYSSADGWISSICEESTSSPGRSQYASGAATVAGGAKKSSSRFCSTKPSESMDSTRS
ncbi:hypothetical protein CFIMG_003363RAa [Ceratocystis fimbriata CBS 114723]|uniref:Uncharacterized protein n=1 Tax=Ceratocystis fimbriata CBS 114723 TaxID=1035309 RepID=A0A2C5XCS8_9PEZI|nr:hypothetical protein CFIMG_003363RAa [Ceratocystis fimbriata CBS 114723]